MCSIFGYCGPSSEDTARLALVRTAPPGPGTCKTLPAGNGWLGCNNRTMTEMCGHSSHLSEHSGSLCVHSGHIFRSTFDGLLPMYERMGTSMFRFLDGSFALIIYDARTGSFTAARDPIGICPLYYGYDEKDTIIFASEPKNLIGLCDKIYPFPPGHYYEGGRFVCYQDLSDVRSYRYDGMKAITEGIHDRLADAVIRRLEEPESIGFLLSGGIDSSLVTGIAARYLGKKVRTFAVGMEKDAIDLKYAREVAEYIGSEHTEVILTQKDVLSALEPVISMLGTYDITTIRASIAMYLLCKYIHENTDIRILLTGEISDELFGYKYTDFAPDARSFQREEEKRIREIHMYDVLRANRCAAANFLDIRIPFGDLSLVDYVMHIDPEKKMNRNGIGKYLLRRAFAGDKIIPESILMREKAALSDAVGHSLRDGLLEYAESLYTDEEFEQKRKFYRYAAPFTKESLLYRELFEKYYPNQAQLVRGFWMPNRSWKGCNVNDPSARVLPNYGASGI